MPARTVLAKGPQVGRQDILNPPPVQVTLAAPARAVEVGRRALPRVPAGGAVRAADASLCGRVFVRKQFRRGRDASLSFAMTLDPKNSPYLAIAFGTRGVLGPIALSVWHNKPVLIRGGKQAWTPGARPPPAESPPRPRRVPAASPPPNPCVSGPPQGPAGADEGAARASAAVSCLADWLNQRHKAMLAMPRDTCPRARGRRPAGARP